METCPNCKGSGKCKTCEGTGKDTNGKDCKPCLGSGKCMDKSPSGFGCHGTGEVVKV